MPKDVDELINRRSTEVLPMSSPVGPIHTLVGLHLSIIITTGGIKYKIT